MCLHVTRLVLHRLAVIEDHHGCRCDGVVLSRVIDPIGVLRAGKDIARDHLRLGERPFGTPSLTLESAPN